MARTIDNLGLDVSIRFAQEELIDKSFIKEGRTVPGQAQIDVTTPSYTSEFEHLFGLGKSNAPWADFFAPQGFYDQKKRLFSQRLIPILGTPDKTDAELQRVMATGKKVIRKEEGQEEKEQQQKQPQTAEEELELSDEEKEKKILVTLFKQLQNLDQVLIDINSRRSQYQKG